MQRSARIARHVVGSAPAATEVAELRPVDWPDDIPVPAYVPPRLLGPSSLRYLCCSSRQPCNRLELSDTGSTVAPHNRRYHHSERFEVGDPASYQYFEDEGYVRAADSATMPLFRSALRCAVR
jgi:hypothetical protein